jgi:transcription-repair coupling factor (superfamily II helicase)
MYKRIANAKNKQQLHDLQIELIDRFGLLPLQVKYLLWVTDLKFLANAMGISRISAQGSQGKIEFNEHPNIDTKVLINLIQVHAKRYQMDGPARLKFTIDNTSHEERIHEIKMLLITLNKK